MRVEVDTSSDKCTEQIDKNWFTNEIFYRWMIEWMNEWMNEWINEWMLNTLKEALLECCILVIQSNIKII